MLYGLSGISEGLVKTIGWVDIDFGDVHCRMNIVVDNFPVEPDGILGVEFLRTLGAELSFLKEHFARSRSPGI